MLRTRFLIAFCLLLGSYVLPCARAQEYEGRQLVQAELIADTSAIVPGKAFTIGVRLRMVPGWHTYWKFPGDAGIPTEIKWKLPDGWKAGEIQWPLPLKLDEPGDIQIYGYHDEVLLMQEITPVAAIPDSSIKLSAAVSWLVCEKLCIPGEAPLELTLPVGKEAGSSHGEIFQKFRAMLPQDMAFGNLAGSSWSRGADNLSFKLKNPDFANYAYVDFYPLPADNVVVGHPRAEKHGDELSVTIPIQSQPVPDRIAGLIVVGKSAEDPGRLAASLVWAEAATPKTNGLLSFLLFGFIGGFILNLMPCVLPVISLKIFGLIQHAGSDRRRILRNGLAFVAGIFVWFIALAVFLIVLKRAGSDVGWSIQFTNPYFVLGLCVLVLVFALNLFGVFEITLPQSANRKVMVATEGSSDAASFFQGVFATILGTSCTAPVLGYAVGFSLTQSNLVILLMFLAIAAGMAFPYLLLSAQPAWVKFLPRPGAWMERVKQFMGFPMLATLVFLLYVLGAQRGSDAIIWASAFLVIVGLACWMKGALVTPVSSTSRTIVVLLLILAFLLGGGWYFIGQKFAQTKLELAASATSEGWQSFTPEKLEAALAENRPVFIDFTAAWCITCKFNESTVLETSAVRDAFKNRGVLKLKADWTNADPTITKYLKQFGRAGVPLYVLYPGGKTPVVLPELLTQNLVLEKLETIAPTAAHP